MKSFNKLFFIFIILNLFDALVTYYALSNGIAKEINPLADYIFIYYGLWTIWILKVVGMVVIYFIMTLKISNITNKTLQKYNENSSLLNALIGISALIVVDVNNVLVIFKEMIWIDKQQTGEFKWNIT